MSAKEIFEHGDERQCAAVAERSARWLVRFQTVAAPAGRISGIDRFLSSAERKCRLISESDALLASKCEQLLERLRAAAPSCGAISTCAGHGDYCEQDRKSTRLNSSHQIISYAVFCLKKKNNTNN